MKGKMRKLVAFMLATIMVLAMGITASAQRVGAEVDNTATITINNASKGETYAVYKLFSASVTGTENGSIAYTGDIPDSLATYFTKDASGNVTATAAAKDASGNASEGLQDALAAWTESQTATATAVSDGSTLDFVGLEYGYYVVTTSQGSNALTVTSTNPDASVYDKNASTPSVDPNEGKKVDDDDVYIGQTVSYKLTFGTSNYDGSGEDAKKIVSYTVHDTLPEYLSDVTVTDITIKQNGEADQKYQVDGQVPQFVRTDGEGAGTITIPWVDTDNKSLYKNGATVEVTYTAKVNEKVQIAGAGSSNTFKLTYKVEDESTDKTPIQSESTEVIKTYALLIKKVDQNGKNLTGATFSVGGLQTEGNNGVYTVTGLTAEGGTDTVMTTDNNGVLIVKGVASGTYQITEEAAPAGYNKLVGTKPVIAAVTSETTTTKTVYLDADGNEVGEDEKVNTVICDNDTLAASVAVIVNLTGAILPSTGGIGTTIFYVVGGILVAAAGILLITKKRMSGRD